MSVSKGTGIECRLTYCLRDFAAARVGERGVDLQVDRQTTVVYEFAARPLVEQEVQIHLLAAGTRR